MEEHLPCNDYHYAPYLYLLSVMWSAVFFLYHHWIITFTACHRQVIESIFYKISEVLNVSLISNKK
jgi:hypothetical protein